MYKTYSLGMMIIQCLLGTYMPGAVLKAADTIIPPVLCFLKEEFVPLLGLCLALPTQLCITEQVMQVPLCHSHLAVLSYRSGREESQHISRLSLCFKQSHPIFPPCLQLHHNYNFLKVIQPLDFSNTVSSRLPSRLGVHRCSLPLLILGLPWWL